jgi:hypothetical protein
MGLFTKNAYLVREGIAEEEAGRPAAARPIPRPAAPWCSMPPTALGRGWAAARSLAVSVIGGVLSSTTLWVVPVVFQDGALRACPRSPGGSCKGRAAEEPGAARVGGGRRLGLRQAGARGN